MEGISSESEVEKIRQDDILMWRTLFIAEVARHGRAVHPLRSDFRFLLEEGAVLVKPATAGGSLEIEVPKKKKEEARGRKGDEPIGSSKDLARWVPGLMRSVPLCTCPS